MRSDSYFCNVFYFSQYHVLVVFYIEHQVVRTRSSIHIVVFLCIYFLIYFASDFYQACCYGHYYYFITLPIIDFFSVAVSHFLRILRLCPYMASKSFLPGSTFIHSLIQF